MNTTIDLGEFAGVVAGLLVIGTILKNAFPSFPNRLIPLVTWLLGVPSYLVMSADWTDPKQWLAAVIAAATATGTHSALKNTAGADDSKAGGMTMLFLAMFATCAVTGTGCRSLEAGGVYQGDSVLYHAELSITTSYDMIHAYVAWEKENREALRAWPEIKESADFMRVNGQQWFASALALRDVYAANPTPEANAALQRSLSVLRAGLAEAAKYMALAAAKP